MTQYQHQRPSIAAVESASSPSARDSNLLEHRIKSLSDRVEQQAAALREIERSIRKLQNEVRTTINAFNLGRHG